MRWLVFLQLLAVSIAVSVITSWAVVLLFDNPIRMMCRHLVGETLSSAWHRFLRFGLLVTGISSGVSMWTLEVYRSAIGTLQATACALFTFFLVALIAHVVLKRAQSKVAAESA